MIATVLGKTLLPVLSRSFFGRLFKLISGENRHRPARLSAAIPSRSVQAAACQIEILEKRMMLSGIRIADGTGPSLDGQTESVIPNDETGATLHTLVTGASERDLTDSTSQTLSSVSRGRSAENSTDTRNPLASTVISAHMNVNGSMNRSGISDLTFNYSEAVTVSSVSALNLFNHTTGQSIDLSTAILINNGTSSVTWDLTGVTLADGRYTAELPATAASPGLARTYTFELFQLTGDANGDGAVSFSDYTAVNANFGNVVSAFGDGDVTGDGVVSFSDYITVHGNFASVLDALELDFGDVPQSADFPTTLVSDGARHVITGNSLFLGASRDAEPDGQPSADAAGDGTDENGIVFGDLKAGSGASVTVTASVPSTAVLNGWIDFNDDGDWEDADEQVFVDEPIIHGSNEFTIAVPAEATLGTTYSRFRLSESAGYSWSGLAANGEDEDYQLLITGADVPRIVLGASDNIALDQPRVAVALTEDIIASAADDFESGGFSGGSDQWQAGTWTVAGDTSIQTDTPHGGSFYARLRTTGDLQRTVDTTGLSGVRLQFWSQISAFESSDQASVEVSSDGTNWIALKTFGETHNDDRYHVFDLAVPDSGDTLFIRFDCDTSSAGATWSLDDISVVDDPIFLGTDQVGPFVFNEFLLDTGANSVLVMASAVSEMVDGSVVYQTEGEFFEQGVAGISIFDIGAPYNFYFAANGNGYHPQAPLANTRVLSNDTGDFSPFGPWGIGGMPLMEGRVTTLDFSGWSGGLNNNLSNLLMVTTFSDTVPQGQNRYTVPVDNRLSFDPEHGILEGDHPPVWSDIPIMSAILAVNGMEQAGNFLLDTGAQLGILSSEIGFNLGLDSNGDGVLDPDDDNYVDTFGVGGVGGTIDAHMFFIEEVRLPTEQGVELVWTDIGWLIVDIETPEGQPSLDGVIGSDLFTSGWFNAVFAAGPDGHLQQSHFDFRDWSSGSGTIYFDITSTGSAAKPTGAAFLPVTLSQLSNSRSLVQQLSMEFAGSLSSDPLGISFSDQHRVPGENTGEPDSDSGFPLSVGTSGRSFGGRSSITMTSTFSPTVSVRTITTQGSGAGIEVWKTNRPAVIPQTPSAGVVDSLVQRSDTETGSLNDLAWLSKFSEWTTGTLTSEFYPEGARWSSDVHLGTQVAEFFDHEFGYSERRDAVLYPHSRKSHD